MTDNRTTELREKLDELGIKHFDYDKGGRTQTMWEAPDGKRHFTYETSNNSAKTARLVIAWHPIPEQAIAATLVNGTCHERTCHIVTTWCDSDYLHDVNYRCSECGGLIIVDERNPDDYFEIISHANYCCNCGAKVIREVDNANK